MLYCPMENKKSNLRSWETQSGFDAHFTSVKTEHYKGAVIKSGTDTPPCEYFPESFYCAVAFRDNRVSATAGAGFGVPMAADTSRLAALTSVKSQLDTQEPTRA